MAAYLENMTMYRITILKDGFVKSVQYNKDSEKGESIARMQYGDTCDYIVEAVQDLEPVREQPPYGRI